MSDTISLSRFCKRRALLAQCDVENEPVTDDAVEDLEKVKEVFRKGLNRRYRRKIPVPDGLLRKHVAYARVVDCRTCIIRDYYSSRPFLRVKLLNDSDVRFQFLSYNTVFNRVYTGDPHAGRVMELEYLMDYFLALQRCDVKHFPPRYVRLERGGQMFLLKKK